jgi:hypothetical protein
MEQNKCVVLILTATKLFLESFKQYLLMAINVRLANFLLNEIIEYSIRFLSFNILTLQSLHIVRRNFA